MVSQEVLPFHVKEEEIQVSSSVKEQLIIKLKHFSPAVGGGHGKNVLT